MKTKLFANAISILLFGTVAVGEGFGQRLPDPTPINQNLADPNTPNYDGFKKSYATAGEPRILVICGMDTRAGDRVQRPVASGAVQDDVFIGNNLALFDAGGDAMAIKSAIEEHLVRSEVRLVDLGALQAKERREVELMENRGMDSAISLLGSKLNADVILVVRLIPGTGGARYRVIYEATNVAAGRKIGGYSFDWEGATDSKSIKTYSQALTRKFFDQYISYYSRTNAAAATYVIRLVGLPDVGQYRAARDAVKKIAGIKQVYDGETAVGRGAVATMEVRYEGSWIDLADDMQTNLARTLGLRVAAIDTSAGAITLAAQVEKPQSVAAILVDPQDKDYKAKVSEFQSAYTNRGSPKIGVMVNREATESEKQDAVQRAKADSQRADVRSGAVPATQAAAPVMSGTFVTIALAGQDANVGGGSSGAPSAGDQAAPSRTATGSPAPRSPKETAAQLEASALDTRRMENKLFKRLVSLQVQAVDMDRARAKILADMQKQQRVFNDQELALLLGQTSESDIVISGIGRIERATGANSRPSVTYTFRAVRTSSGAVLAAEDYSFQLPFGAGVVEEAAFDAAADSIIGNLAVQMQSYWAPPSRLTITVNNAMSPREVSTIMTFFKDSIPGVRSTSFESHDSGAGTGVGKFSIQYDVTYEELLKRITEMGNGKLPFDLDAGNNRGDTMTISIRKAA